MHKIKGPMVKTSSGIIHQAYGKMLDVPIHYTYTWQAGSKEWARLRAIHEALKAAGITKP
jgi:hypothetical protein